MSQLDSSPSKEMQTHLYHRLAILGHDFAAAAAEYGKIIVNEQHLPFNLKTVRPIQLPGSVGGEKFIIHDILFKFAVDNNNFLGGDKAAMKIAGHEISGLNSLMESNISGLYYPLMAVVDYRGYRLVAISTLPINQYTIKHGSYNAGKTVFSNYQDLDKKIEKACKSLNLQERHHPPQHILYGPVDLEGHEGADRRFYLVDFSRLLPPDQIDKSKLCGYLFELLRPELVRSYEVPLCSDALSQFIPPSDWIKFAEPIYRASNYLQNEIIPRFCALLAQQDPNQYSQLQLIQTLHRQGINLRYLGLVYHQLRSLLSSPSSSFSSGLGSGSNSRSGSNTDVWGARILLEMTARSLKWRFRERLRLKSKQLNVDLPLEIPFLEEAVSFLNQWFGGQYQTTWTRENLFGDLQQNFKLSLSSSPPDLKLNRNSMDGTSWLLSMFSESFGSLDVKFSESSTLFCSLFWRFCDLVEVQLVPSIQFSGLLSFLSSDRPFKRIHIVSLHTRVRHATLLEYANGVMLKNEAKQETNPQTKQAYLELCRESFERALESDPSHTDSLLQLAQILSRYQNTIGDAERYFEIAIRSASRAKLPLACYKYARFLHCYYFETRSSDAEHGYLQAISLDNNFFRAHLRLGELLTTLEDWNRAFAHFFHAFSLIGTLYRNQQLFDLFFKQFLTHHPKYTYEQCIHAFKNEQSM